MFKIDIGSSASLNRRNEAHRCYLYIDNRFLHLGAKSAAIAKPARL